MGVVALQPLGPLLPGEVLSLAHAVGRLGLGVVAVQLQVPQLGVGDQDAVVDQGDPDPGAERREDDEAVLALGRAVAHLGDARRVGVVDDVHVPAEPLREQRVGVAVDPALVDVGRRADDAVGHDAGHGDADRRVRTDLVQLVDDLRDHVGDRLWGRVLGGGDPDPLGGELAGLEVDRGSLDAAAPDVDAEGEAGAA